MCFLCDDPVPDEIPGDPQTVRGFANTFHQTAVALREAAIELRNVANENITISLAIDEVRDRADEVTANTDRVATRYEDAGTTFTRYANSLEDARNQGNGARNQIIANNESGRYWRHRERELRALVRFGNTDPEVLADLQEATLRANSFDGQYGTLIGRYSVASDNFQRAVAAAIQGLNDAEAAAGLNDEWYEALVGDFALAWELISEYLGPVIEILRDVLEIIKQIVDVLALIVAIAAIFFPALAVIATGLAALSAILGVAIFACSALLFLMGRETLGRVLADGIMAVVGVVTAKLGVNGVAQESLGQMVGAGVTSTRAVASGATSVTLATSLGAEAMEFIATSGLHSVVEAGGEVFSFVAGEGIDLEIGGMPWGEEPFDMTGADPTDLILATVNPMTLGTLGMVETIVVDGVMPIVDGVQFLVEAGASPFPDLVHPAVCATGS